MMLFYRQAKRVWPRILPRWLFFADVAAKAPLFGLSSIDRAGTARIGFGGGLFAVGALTTSAGLDIGSDLTSSKGMADNGQSGLASGARIAIQATVLGTMIVIGCLSRDLFLFSRLAVEGALGSAVAAPSVGCLLVNHLASLFLFATLMAVGLSVWGTGVVMAPLPSRLGSTELC